MMREDEERGRTCPFASIGRKASGLAHRSGPTRATTRQVRARVKRRGTGMLKADPSSFALISANFLGMTIFSFCKSGKWVRDYHRRHIDDVRIQTQTGDGGSAIGRKASSLGAGMAGSSQLSRGRVQPGADGFILPQRIQARRHLQEFPSDVPELVAVEAKHQ